VRQISKIARCASCEVPHRGIAPFLIEGITSAQQPPVDSSPFLSCGCWRRGTPGYEAPWDLSVAQNLGQFVFVKWGAARFPRWQNRRPAAWPDSGQVEEWRKPQSAASLLANSSGAFRTWGNAAVRYSDFSGTTYETTRVRPTLHYVCRKFLSL